MRLTRIEIHGFKSFADRTPLEFPPGLTAVVGPNGCGKSNVIDAIKWALGEQRASALRGDEMLDVIFKGNGARAARNFAEVSLHFDNGDQTLPIDFSEVVVSRRLFRSGESEYLINRQSARLKDVRNLFMDTGLGTGAYSIMEQGRIDAILSADPQARRRIFEEAAGISRYRARRRESESRLERTQQNLLRLGDVIEELEKQVRSLKNQAGRARSYIAARDRLGSLRALFYAHRWEELATRGRELSEQGAALAETEAEARHRVSAARAEAAALAAQLEQARREADEAAEAFRQVTSTLESLDGRRTALREREAEAEERGRQLGHRLKGLEVAVAQRSEEARTVAERLAAVGLELQAAERVVAEHEQHEQAAVERLGASREALERHRRAALERQGELTECRNVRAEADSRHAAVAASRDRVGHRADELRRQLEEHGAVQGELFADARGLESAAETAHAQQGEQLGLLKTARERSGDLEGRLNTLRERLAAVQSRRDALAEMLARHEGVSPGARSLLESDLPGIDGLIVERLRAPRELSEAVEAALGATTEAVLVGSRADALAALQYLSHNGAGRVLLLPRDELRPREHPAPGDRLLDHLELLGEQEALNALLGHVRLVPDRTALQACPLDGVTVYVTPEGDLLDERGVLRGGRMGEEGGLVTRRAECDALEQEIGTLRELIEGLAGERRTVEQEVAVLEQRAQEAERTLRRIETERERAAEREQQGAARQAAMERELAVTDRDLAALEQELAEEAGRRDAASARVAALETAAEEDRSREAQLAEKAEQDEQELGGRRSELAESRVALSTLRERQQALSGEERQVVRASEERRDEHERVVRELSELANQIQQMQRELSELDEREASVSEQRDAAAGVLGTARDRSAELSGRVESGQRAVEEREAELEARVEAVGQHRLAEQENGIHRETLRTKVLEELGVDLDQQGPQAVEADPQTDWAAVESEIDELRQRMGRMGNVNLAAVDELTEVEERLTFLTGQRDDLLAARASLMDTIAKVNRESRERFVATFEEIREHFRQIFRKLFRGGRADVFLAEGEDVLEAGIDIVAAPPGKDPRSISLLSGGERTLTAVGLLFALFRAKPSPVCLLDEVDAALDETNIDRFCTVLEDFLRDSQFLVVTHARRTMSYADTLYGITMQEHGVSRALSLTLQEYDEGEATGEPTAAAQSGASRLPTNGKPPHARPGNEQEVGHFA
jgi:chromosome segregation protein